MFTFFEIVNPHIFNVLISIFKFKNFLLKRPKILIFTDSRGFEVTKFWNRKNPFSSYVGNIVLQYNCTVKVCPEKFTSILDFLEFYQSVRHKKFDKVILHCGIVDFAPRPESSFDSMYVSKLSKTRKYLIEEHIRKENRIFGEKYQGENTLSFLNDDSVSMKILPLLKRIPNLVYISINPVLDDWDGNYWRKRPSNINEQLLLDNLLINEVDEVIDMSNLQRDEVIMYTSDNVHYTKAGFCYIYNKLIPLLPKI